MLALVLKSKEISFRKGFSMVRVDGTSVTTALSSRYRAKGSDMDMILIWSSLLDTLAMWISVCCRLGTSDIMTVLASRTVAFTGGSVGFGVSLAETFCTGKENEIWHRHQWAWYRVNIYGYFLFMRSVNQRSRTRRRRGRRELKKLHEPDGNHSMKECLFLKQGFRLQLRQATKMFLRGWTQVYKMY